MEVISFYLLTNNVILSCNCDFFDSNSNISFIKRKNFFFADLSERPARKFKLSVFSGKGLAWGHNALWRFILIIHILWQPKVRHVLAMFWSISRTVVKFITENKSIIVKPRTKANAGEWRDEEKGFPAKRALAVVPYTPISQTPHYNSLKVLFC